MGEAEYRKKLEGYTPAKLVDSVINLMWETGKLKAKIKILEEEHMQDVNKYKEQIAKTNKIVEYWEKKERPLRREDFSNDEVVKRYVGDITNGVKRQSAYRISKDMGIGQMTVISRLKRANVYEGKDHDTEE